MAQSNHQRGIAVALLLGAALGAAVEGGRHRFRQRGKLGDAHPVTSLQGEWYL
jgi:hypothetical protein